MSDKGKYHDMAHDAMRAMNVELEGLRLYGDIGELLHELADAIPNMPLPHKTATGQDGHRKFEYAPPEEYRKVIMPELQKKRIALMQPVTTTEAGRERVYTIVGGRPGMIIGWQEFDGEPNVKGLGGQQTYRGRYGLRAGFVLPGDTPDPDSYGSGEVPSGSQRQRKPTPQPTTLAPLTAQALKEGFKSIGINTPAQAREWYRDLLQIDKPLAALTEQESADVLRAIGEEESRRLDKATEPNPFDEELEKR